ncbi:MAG: Holliday junction resolvase RuvX [Bacteroidota bacterium]
MRIIAIDYGSKRTGLAWTDPMQIIATGIGSFDTPLIEAKLKELVAKESVETIVLGYPTRLDGSDTHITAAVREFEIKLKTWFPAVQVLRWDERFTSKEASRAILEGGAKKKKRQDKHLVNEVAATLLLQDYMQYR